jgi:anti-anti-sigma factor
VIDLRQLEFIDSQGVRLLLMLREIPEGNGDTFRLVAGSDSIQRVFVLTGALDLFDWA